MNKMTPRLDQLKSGIEKTIIKQVIDRTFDIHIWAAVGRPSSFIVVQRIIKNELDK